jgi:hypothetical protein
MAMTIQAVDAVLRRGEPVGWEVRFTFAVALDDGSHELWNSGGGLGVATADVPDALALASTLEDVLETTPFAALLIGWRSAPRNLGSLLGRPLETIRFFGRPV